MEAAFTQKTEGKCVYKMLAKLGAAIKGHSGIKAKLI